MRCFSVCDASTQLLHFQFVVMRSGNRFFDLGAIYIHSVHQIAVLVELGICNDETLCAMDMQPVNALILIGGKDHTALENRPLVPGKGEDAGGIDVDILLREICHSLNLPRLFSWQRQDLAGDEAAQGVCEVGISDPGQVVYAQVVVRGDKGGCYLPHMVDDTGLKLVHTG